MDDGLPDVHLADALSRRLLQPNIGLIPAVAQRKARPLAAAVIRSSRTRILMANPADTLLNPPRALRGTRLSSELRRCRRSSTQPNKATSARAARAHVPNFRPVDAATGDGVGCLAVAFFVRFEQTVGLCIGSVRLPYGASSHSLACRCMVFIVSLGIRRFAAYAACSSLFGP